MDARISRMAEPRLEPDGSARSAPLKSDSAVPFSSILVTGWAVCERKGESSWSGVMRG